MTATETTLTQSAWKKVTLKDIVSLQRGHDLTDRQRREGDVPVMSAAGQYGFHDKALVRGPGVVMGRSGASIGQVHFCEADFWPHNTALYVTSFHGNDPRFVFYFLQSLHLSRHNTGGAQPSLNRNFIYPLEVIVPKPMEQRAIAAALSDVDELIGALDKLIAKKRSIKLATMQQLLTGKTRLPGFRGEWETKLLGQCGECLRGVSYDPQTDLSPHDTNTTTRLFRSNNVQEAAVTTYDLQFVNLRRVSPDQLMRLHDILLCMANGSKDLVGKSGLFQVSDGYHYTFGAFMACFRTNHDMANARFIAYVLQSQQFRDYVGMILAGSSINNLKPSDIEAAECFMPDSCEQEAIATVLSDMDAEITALEQRRNKTKAIKQGMMQQLLTGRIRLVEPEGTA